MKNEPHQNEDEFDRMEELFCRAVEMASAEERAAYFEKECGDDAELRFSLERMVHRHLETEDFFEKSAPAKISAVEISQTLADIPDFFETLDAVHADDDEVGKQIGPYKLLQKIGEGGVGNVYLAEQVKPVRRQVALKVIKLGMDTKSVIARFEAERQALAMMEHPNIAHVLGAGETETGRPFFVMELVHGVRITSYCDDAGLDVRRRLELFVQVCHAIQHAHQKGIIHRDIKPSNVLITLHDGVPMPMVIDFGIAKATSAELLPEQTLETLHETFIGTPAYMSPEQAQVSVLDIDTRSDIYGLGALLYELLAGRTPFEHKELMARGIDRMRQILCEVDPPKPSLRFQRLEPATQEQVARQRAMGPLRLVSVMAEDLDCIVMKALEKDRARRYETADAFALDIERFLNHEPVAARPPSRLYRFRKLVRRNQVVFAAVGAVSVALVAGIALSTWMFVKERAARHRAVTAERLAEEARANERVLRQQSEIREKIAQSAFLLSRNHPEDAESLMAGIRLEEATIEGAAVLRQLGAWHALRGEWAQAVLRYRQLLQVNRLDNLDIASLDFLACEAVFLEVGATNELASLRGEMIARSSGNWPVQTVARMLEGALLLPVDQATLASLQPLVDFVMSQVQPGTDESSAENRSEENYWDRLKLIGCGMNDVHWITQNSNTVTFVAGGSNIWEERDSFEFAYMTVLGDFDFRLHIHSITEEDMFSRVGLMARVSVDDPGSRHIMVAINAQNTFQVLLRSQANGGTTSLPPNPLPEAWGSNSWVRLQRVGSTFRSYGSDNGLDWVLFDSYDSTRGVEGQFVDPIYVGIAASAHHPDSLTQAVLSDFSTPPATSIEAMLSLALLHYRSGEFAACAEACRRCWSEPELNAPRTAIIRVLLALSSQKLGHAEEASAQLSKAREMIDNKFESPLDAGSRAQGHWFDWIIARALLREAADLEF